MVQPKSTGILLYLWPAWLLATVDVLEDPEALIAVLAEVDVGLVAGGNVRDTDAILQNCYNS